MILKLYEKVPSVVRPNFGKLWQQIGQIWEHLTMHTMNWNIYTELGFGCRNVVLQTCADYFVFYSGKVNFKNNLDDCDNSKMMIMLNMFKKNE